jgi:hypothetical protein
MHQEIKIVEFSSAALRDLSANPMRVILTTNGRKNLNDASGNQDR